MGYLLAGFLGVLLGGGLTAAVALVLLQRLVDRDLLERRLRALSVLREALGSPQALLRGAALDRQELEQLVRNLEEVGKEFRLTGWVFEEPLRAELVRALSGFEEEVRRARGRGERPSPVRVIDSYRQLELVLRQSARRELRDFRRWRALLAPRSARQEPEPAASPESHRVAADLPDERLFLR